MAQFPYPGKFTFLDVEIPNQNSDRICAISLIVVEEGKEIVRHTELINPQTFFSATNISVHHIRSKDVQNARTVEEFWKDFSRYFEDPYILAVEEFWKDFSRYFEDPYILAAHNTRSDVTVLNKDLSRFDTQIHSTRFIDTMDIMEQFYYKGNQKKGDLKLNSIAAHLGIPLDHHDPASDVNCCYEVVRYMANHFDMDLDPFIKELTPPKHFHPHTNEKPDVKAIKAFLWNTRNEISRNAKNTRITEKNAKSKGPPKHFHPHTNEKPDVKAIKAFLWNTRNEISRNAKNTRITEKNAKSKGDDAWKEDDFENMVFFYEVLWNTRNEISRNAKNTRITEKNAKSKGDDAWKEDDFENMVFFYEVAISKNCVSPLVYLRLADFYDSLNMRYDALRVLDKGINALKKMNHGWQELAAARFDIRRGNNHPKKNDGKGSQPTPKSSSARTAKDKKPQTSASKPSEPKKKRFFNKRRNADRSAQS